MDGRMKKFRQLSLERAKVWMEKSPKYVRSRKVPVVYYSAHFIEVLLSSLEGLYLRGTVKRTIVHHLWKI
ncbi:hypothetical protein Nepgr_031040 [Nepenthes gracilis]|uniref:Uncharacterized protein n=1 Tax=Nepenthes gracilis TaxID=150966 RepID=A0AAD3TGS6_NEPGR|nr:hypothetical protein Nepgr_031040 [Nepenthes gracilis]